jgi:hypothetical protein
MPLAAVHRHLVPALNQSNGKLLRERLEPAVVCGNAARAEERDAHAYVFAVSDRESIRAIFFGAFLLTGAYWNQLAM